MSTWIFNFWSFQSVSQIRRITILNNLMHCRSQLITIDIKILITLDVDILLTFKCVHNIVRANHRPCYMSVSSWEWIGKFQRVTSVRHTPYRVFCTEINSIWELRDDTVARHITTIFCRLYSINVCGILTMDIQRILMVRTNELITCRNLTIYL